MDLATAVALGSAIATACSAVFVGWQALETRRTAQSSRKAAEDGRDAVRVANATLELARDQSQQSAILVKDTIRARLDIKAPAISMTLRRGTSMAADHFMVRKTDEPLMLKPVDTFEETPFELPGDQATTIFAVYLVTFHNDGLVPVTIRSDSVGRKMSGFFVWQKTLRVPVGESVEALLALGATVDEWARALGANSVPLPRGGWESVMHEDTGVRMSQEFHIEAPMILQVADDENGSRYSIPADKAESRKRASIVFGAQKRWYVIAGENVESLTPTAEEADMLALQNPR